jgi:predicted permease
VDEVVGDLDEAHRLRLQRHSRFVAAVLTAFEAIDIAWALRGASRTRPFDVATARTRRALPFSWLDFKLGLRMLARYPGMTVVSATAMAFGIALGAGGLHLARELLFPDLPYADRDRVVAIQKLDTRTGRVDARALQDLPIWKDRLTTVEHLGARSNARRNLAIDGTVARPVLVASISPVAFDLAPAPPLLGRPLVPADEGGGAAAVAVISHALWRSSFDGDAGVVGRRIQLGGEPYTVVGVMPPEYRLPVPSNDLFYLFEEDLWIPFRADPLPYPPGEGPAVDVFGQLTEGATFDEAQAELTALGLSVEASPPEAHPHLIPQLVSFADPFGLAAGLRVQTVLLLSVVFVVLVMAMLCANVALLMYARAASREAEIVVRSALGASRARVVGQLFVEALAIASVAIFVGLVGATWGARWVFDALDRVAMAGGQAIPPIDLSLSATTMLSAAALALVGAVVAGVLPGLKVTGRASPGLPKSPGRGGAAALGGVWSAIIVAQVALTTAVVPWAGGMGVTAWRASSTDLGFDGHEYLAARIDMDGEPAIDPSFAARYEASYRELVRRVASEPAVSRVTVGDALPALYHFRRFVEIDSPRGPVALEPSIQVATVDPSFFDVFGATIVAGRGFGTTDLDAAARTVIVNESFVREVLGGVNAVGRRFRYPNLARDGEVAPWLEIIGVTEDLVMFSDPLLTSNAGIYHPVRPLAIYPLRIAVHVPGGAAAVLPRLREIAGDISPELRLFNPMTLDRALDAHVYAYGGWAWFLAVAGSLAILLTNAGIYAIVSYTVSRRTREIGVRVALGADQGQIVWTVLAAMAKRVVIGILIGALLFTPMALEMGPAMGIGLSAWALGMAYLALMVGVCMAACLAPTRRALSIEPTEALASE